MIPLREVLMLPIKSQAQKTDVLYPLPPKHRMTGGRVKYALTSKYMTKI